MFNIRRVVEYAYVAVCSPTKPRAIGDGACVRGLGYEARWLMHLRAHAMQL